MQIHMKQNNILSSHLQHAIYGIFIYKIDYNREIF